MKSVPMTAQCQRFSRNPSSLSWDPVSGEIVNCPALVGKHMVTVWLPDGGKISRKHSFADSSPDGGPLVIPPKTKLGICFGQMKASKFESDMVEFSLVPDPVIPASSKPKR